MAARTLESRFERLSVRDENEPVEGSKLHLKSKVRRPHSTFLSSQHP